MAKWTQKQQILGIGGGAIAVSLLSLGGVYYAQGLIEEVKASIEEKTQAIAAADAKITQIPAIERDVIVLRENLDQYVKILPDTRDLNDFLRILTMFGKQSGIEGINLTRAGDRNAKGGDRFALIEYNYDFTATMWQFLKFVNLVENYDRFISISSFDITALAGGKNSEETREGDVVHTIKLTMQTYQYNGKAAGLEVGIPDYEEKREALREEIFKRMQAIRIDKYEHRGQQGRRDIFVDPRERGDLHIEGPSQAEQRAVLERYVGAITELREMQTRMRRTDTTLFEQYALEKRMRENLVKLAAEVDNDANKVSYAPYRLRWTKEVVAPLEELQQQIDQAGRIDPKRGDPYLPLADIEALITAMKSDLDTGDLQEAKNRYDTVETRLAVPADDPRHELAVAAKALQVMAATAIDFQSIDLRIQGLVVNRTGRSGVLLNGEVFEEGEYVSEELLVKMVEEEQVWFVFRGLTLVRTM